MPHDGAVGTGYFTVPAWSEGRQAVLNAHPVPPRKAQRDAPDPIPVRARVVWERDGEELVETVAQAWTSRLVLVTLSDRRAELRGVWLDPRDVQRLTPRGDAPR